MKFLVSLLLSIICLCSCNKPNRENINDALDTDTLEQIEAPSVKEVLEWREQLRYRKFVDSVFLAMPEQILTNILVTKGTDLSNEEIVGIYMSSKEFYDRTIKGAMDIQKEYIPDSMPTKPIPQQPKDTITQPTH